MALSTSRWSGKVAVVTGASSGIGAAIADALVEHGLQVVGVARRSQIIERRSRQLSDKPGKLHALRVDLSNRKEIEDSFKWIEENLGPIHVLVNSAGLVQMGGVMDTEPEHWKQTFDVNVLGLFVTTKEAIKQMRANNINGHVVQINGVFGHKIPTHEFNIGPSSKFAVTAFSETLRLEMAALECKIKITSVSPGLVATELTTKNESASQEAMEYFSRWPILNVEDVVGGVVYALSTPEHVQVNELTIVGI